MNVSRHINFRRVKNYFEKVKPKVGINVEILWLSGGNSKNKIDSKNLLENNFRSSIEIFLTSLL